MRARVFVTLKPSVFDPQGKTIADALHSLGYGGVERRSPGQVLRARPGGDRTAAAGASAGVGSGRQAARQPGHRELSHRESRRWHDEIRRRRFPGINCDHDAYHAAKHVLGQDAEFIWHKDTDLQGRRRRDPARRLRARRLPAHRRHRALLAGHARSARRSPTAAVPCSASATAFRFCSRPGCCRARCCATAASSSAASTSTSASSRPTRRSRRRARRARCCGFRSRTAKATTSRRPT